MPGTNGGQEEKWLAEVLKDSEKAKKGSSSRSGSRIGHPRSTRRTHTNLTGRGGSSSSSSQLPRSVRNAPPALRAEIRRFQNRESARRSRERIAEEDQVWAQELRTQNERLDAIERQVQDVTSALSKSRKRDHHSGSSSRR